MLLSLTFDVAILRVALKESRPLLKRDRLGPDGIAAPTMRFRHAIRK